MYIIQLSGERLSLPSPLSSSFRPHPRRSNVPVSDWAVTLRLAPLYDQRRQLLLALRISPFEGAMAASLVSLPPLPQSPLPLSPPCSPGSSQHNPDYSPLTTGIETPTRSPVTSSSFGTTASIDSTIMAGTAQASTAARAEVPEADTQPIMSTSPPSPPPVGRSGPVKLEDFELIRVLGKGCAGRVSPVRRKSQLTPGPSRARGGYLIRTSHEGHLKTLCPRTR